MVKKQRNKNTGKFSGKSAERSQSKEGEQNEKNFRRNRTGISRTKTNFFDGFHQRCSISIQQQKQIHQDSFQDQHDSNESQDEVHSGESEMNQEIKQYKDKRKVKQDGLRYLKYGQINQSQFYNQKRERNNLQQTGIQGKQKIQFNDKTLKKQIIRNNKSYLKLLKEKKCQTCQEKRLPEYEYSQIMLCDICDDAYHRACLQFPLSIEQVRKLENWICPQCAKSYFLNENHIRKINHEASLEQFQHCQHLNSDQFPTDFSLYSEAMLMLTFEQNKNKRLTDLEKSFWTQRQYQWFKLQPYKPISQQAISREKYWIPLIRVLSQYSLFYCPFQVYPSYQIMSLNLSKNHRPNIAQMLSTKDEKAFEEFLESVENGDAPPLTLDKCPYKGYLVRALKKIAAKTIICEYAGEVMTYRQSLRGCVNDSIFNLLETGNSSTTLQIVPRKYANISKYFLGINNSELENYSKINVQSILFSYKGRNRIIFYTLREIAKGQALYINYNGGILNDYPTDNFE